MSFFCPTEEQIRAQVLALLPRGRAWQTNEGGPQETVAGKDSILWQYFAAFANVMTYLHERLCALRMEFWCATHNETNPEWLIEYGLPDACDPFPDLCTKVAAIGGTRCEYYQFIAERAGWKLFCTERGSDCGANMGCATMGCAVLGSTNTLATLIITVQLDEGICCSLGEPTLYRQFSNGLLLGVRSRHLCA
jgi:hypothetical protein